jgi:hypothetical protein
MAESETCPGLESGDCQVLSWTADRMVTARDRKTGQVETTHVTWHCPVMDAAKSGEEEE